MGDSAYLLRSFSHPSSAIRESKEGDPLRALTESISFGRFMSESLAWEKWSTFSHNRYLEEVEQFSKPGYVAQKKAYFEAHYKKRAAMKAAALVEQEESASVNYVPEAESIEDSHNNSSAEQESITGIGNEDMNVQLENDAAEAELTCLANVIPSDSHVRSDKLEKENMQSNPVITVQNGELENSIEFEISSHFVSDEGREKVVSAPEEVMLIQDTTEDDNGSLPNHKRLMNSSPKATDQSRASKIHKSSLTKANSARRKAGASTDTSSKNTLGDLFNKKKLPSKSMHVSINFTSNSGNARKDHLRMLKDISATVQNPIEKSVRRAPNVLKSKAQESTEKRSNPVVNKSVSGRELRSISLKTSKSSGSKSRLSIISSRFSFRREERAAKRNGKLGEKNVKQKETMHQKEKAGHGLPKVRQSFRIKPSEDPCHGLQSLRNQIKIPPTRTRAPKLGRKPAPSMIQEANTQVAQRPKTNSESSKTVIVKSSRSMTRSVTQLPKKKVHENASPNIQR